MSLEVVVLAFDQGEDVDAHHVVNRADLDVLAPANDAQVDGEGQELAVFKGLDGERAERDGRRLGGLSEEALSPLGKRTKSPAKEHV